MSMAFLLRVMRCNEIGPSSLAKGGTNGANSPKLKTTQKTKKQNKKKNFWPREKKRICKAHGLLQHFYTFVFLDFLGFSLFVMISLSYCTSTYSYLIPPPPQKKEQIRLPPPKKKKEKERKLFESTNAVKYIVLEVDKAFVH